MEEKRMVKMTDDEFDAHFKPVKREVPNPQTEWEEMYDTTDDETSLLEAMRTKLGYDHHHIWTIVEAEDKWYMAEGYHYVNRVAYMITEVPWEEGVYYDVCYSC